MNDDEARKKDMIFAKLTVEMACKKMRPCRLLTPKIRLVWDQGGGGGCRRLCIHMLGPSHGFKYWLILIYTGNTLSSSDASDTILIL